MLGSQNKTRGSCLGGSPISNASLTHTVLVLALQGISQESSYHNQQGIRGLETAPGREENPLISGHPSPGCQYLLESHASFLIVFLDPLNGDTWGFSSMSFVLTLSSFLPVLFHVMPAHLLKILVPLWLPVK